MKCGQEDLWADPSLGTWALGKLVEISIAQLTSRPGTDKEGPVIGTRKSVSRSAVRLALMCTETQMFPWILIILSVYNSQVFSIKSGHRDFLGFLWQGRREQSILSPDPGSG